MPYFVRKEKKSVNNRCLGKSMNSAQCSIDRNQSQLPATCTYQGLPEPQMILYFYDCQPLLSFIVFPACFFFIIINTTLQNQQHLAVNSASLTLYKYLPFLFVLIESGIFCFSVVLQSSGSCTGEDSNK